MTHIAFLGTGLMGAPMAANLLAAGHKATVWNRSPDKTHGLARAGARVAVSPVDAAAGAQFVITMLTDGAAVADIIWQQGVADALAPGAVVIDMSSARKTDAEQLAARLKERGHDALDAPVSGGTKGARDATLAIMVGGEQSAYDKAALTLSSLGRPVRVGPAGTGQLAKLINQTIVATAIGAVAEGMVLAEAGGADLAAVRVALAGGFADSAVLQQHGERMQKRDFEPGGPAKHHLKDLRNTQEVVAELGLELPMLTHMLERYAHLCEQMDGGDLDHSALFLELVERNA